MTDPAKLSRREREIMDILFSQGSATTESIREAMRTPPSGNAVRALLVILETKGFLKRHRQGREYSYVPVVARSQAGGNALQHVLETFFEGSFEKAFAAHLNRNKEEMSADDYDRLKQLIDGTQEETK
jgi:BlaI family penicillinase repressor